jgi:glycosyltransferase involved in cell wall biosynthesis
MRVLHVVPALLDAKDGILGGAERYAFELARHMAREVETTLLSFGRADRTFEEGPLRVRVVGNAWHVQGNRFNPFSLRALPELLRADVVHCHQRHVLMSSSLAIAGRVTGRPVFVTDLGGGGLDFATLVKTDGWFRGHLHMSEFSRKVSGHETNRNARVILTGVDAGLFSPSPALEKSTDVVFVGRVLPHKGVDKVIEALPPDRTLDVVGGTFHPEYMAVLKDLARGKQVRFLGELSGQALVDAYRRARAVVLPSLYRDRYGNDYPVPELLGQTLLEGMACGIPAICTDVAAMPEAVVDGETGFVVPPNDLEAMRRAIVTLSTDHALAARMGTAGRERMLTHFTWDAVVKRCLEAYRS